MTHSTPIRGLAVLCLTSTVLCGPLPVLAGSKSVTAELRVECRKTSGRGCTAHAERCFNAPPGHYFTPQSVAGRITGKLSPRTHYCTKASTGKDGVVVNGLLAPTSMCATLHAESGGGIGGRNQVYYIKCGYTAEATPLPR